MNGIGKGALKAHATLTEQEGSTRAIAVIRCSHDLHDMGGAQHIVGRTHDLLVDPSQEHPQEIIAARLWLVEG